jgi:hypothetical protein
MIALNLIVLVIIFITGSFLSTWLMRHYGYPVPRSLKTREDKLLFLMKLILFSLITTLLLIAFLLFGIDPLNLMGRGL